MSYRRQILPTGVLARYLFHRRPEAKKPYSYTKITNMRRRRRYYRSRKPRTFRTGGRGRKRISKMKLALKSVEQKTHDISVTQNLVSGGVITPLTLIAQGDDIGDREGNQITLSKLYGKIIINGNDTDTGARTYRVIFFMDKENTGVHPTSGLIMESNTDISSMFNKLRRVRFKILYDQRFVLATNADEGYPGDKTAVNITVPVRGKTVHYKAATGVEASMYKGQLYMFCYQETPTASAYGSIQGNMRLRYYG